MCGSSPQQNTLQDEQMQFYQQASTEAQQTYGEDQALLQQITSVYAPILAKGPNQEGFSVAEKANLNAQATEGTAQNYAGAAKAVGESQAAEGGGNIAMPTGGQQQLQAEVAAASAGTQSQEENQITQADYQEGGQLFAQAGSALSTASGQLSPTSYTNAATGAGNAAENTANQINTENNSWINAAIGAAGAVGGAAMGNPNLF
jgi:hypothetical protein